MTSFVQGSLCKAKKGTAFLRKDAEKKQFAFNESGYQSQSRYNKPG